MLRTINQIISLMHQPNRLPGWARTCLVTLTLAFCPAFLPIASAGCGGLSAGSQATPALTAISSITPASGSSASASKPGAASIVGLWKLYVLAGGSVVDVAFDAWHSDGTEVLNDYTNPINGNVCLGVWQQTGPGAYTLKHPSWYFDGSGNLLGTVVIHEAITLSSDGNSFSGPSVEDVYDISGHFLYALNTQVKAERIQPD